MVAEDGRWMELTQNYVQWCALLLQELNLQVLFITRAVFHFVTVQPKLNLKTYICILLLAQKVANCNYLGCKCILFKLKTYKIK